MGLKIDRLYTKQNQDVFATCEYKLVDCIIKAADGSIISGLTNVQMPKSWSQNACDIFAHKYLRKAGVANEFKTVAESGIPAWLERSIPAEGATFGAEQSVKQAIKRIAGCWTYNGFKAGYFADEDSARAFFDEVAYMLLHQICSPNSPQWFNTGLHWLYGIEGDSSGQHYHFDGKEIVQSTNAYEHPQVHACFILGVEDHLVGKDGIMDTWAKEAAIFKYGSGAGANFSNLRGEGERLSGGGKSSGLMSFLKIGDCAAGAIKSGGTTRRAAKMVILNDDHPDIEEFVSWKAKEEQKVLALVVGSQKCQKHIQQLQQACAKWSDSSSKYDKRHNPYLKNALSAALKDGIAASYCDQILYALEYNQEIDFPEFTYDWNSQSYRAVSGQNSNNSVRITDKFLKAVEDDSLWELKARTDGRVVKTIRARDLWDQICYSAWVCADPGVQYQNHIDKWHTCKASGPITATNPCSEYVFLDNTACNLASINLDKMHDGQFKVKEFQHAARLLTIALEISVHMAQYPTYDFAARSHEFRTLGLGYASLGSMLMKCGLPYDSEEGRQLTSAITALMTWTAYDASADMAEAMGTFEAYPLNEDHMLEVLELMQKHTSKIQHELAPIALADSVIKKGRRTGFRNAQTTCIAPTGTISFVMDCGSTSCEPSFSLVSWKKLAGGGDMRVLNPEVDRALEALGYSAKQREDIKHYIFGHGNIKYAPGINHQTLMQKGFTQAMLDKIQLQHCYHISHGINSNTFTAEELRLLGSQQDLLGSIFSHTDIMKANLYCCGHLTIEGAPHIKPEHESIFTCAVNNGVGVKSIAPIGHVKMLAAIQPFISGASSKTVNMPESATVEDISNIYLQAHRLGVKCIAIYRNNSKFSQALNVTNFNQQEHEDGKAYRFGMKLAGSAFYILAQEDDQQNLTELEVVMGKEGSSFRTLMDCFAQAISLGLKYGVPLGKYVDAFKNIGFEPSGDVIGFEGITKALSPLDLLARVLETKYPKQSSKRSKPLLSLGATCGSRRAKVIIGGHDFTLHTGESEDGSLAEVFFKISKEGSDFCSLMSSFAKAISIALQYGVDFEAIYNQFIGTKFDPAGIVQGHPQIKSADSVIDFALKCLALWYHPELVSNIAYQALAYTKATSTGYEVEVQAKRGPIEQKRIQTSNQATCSKCFSFELRANGSCYVCAKCGETTGCS